MRLITKAIPTKDFELILTFDNGETRITDIKPTLAKGGIFEPIRNYEVFKTVRVDHDTVVWLDEVDLCPDTLYMKSKPFKIDEEAI